MRILCAFLCFLTIMSSIEGMSVSYGFQGIDSSQFAEIYHKFPLPSLVTVLQNMVNHTEIILRPFNFGATKSYADHSGMGKNTNVKGKSCYLNDETLNGKITYIQSNAYTGRKQADNKITYMGKYTVRDNLANEAFTSALGKHCQEWKDKSIDDIKADVVQELTDLHFHDENLDSTIQYIQQRFMYKVTIDNVPYLTTEFVTTADVHSNSQVPVTEEHCDKDHHCSYEEKSETTNIVKVLAYQALNFDTCQTKSFELVADMDILTIHFPYQQNETDNDLEKYFNDPTGENCQQSFTLAFGISPQIHIVYDYVHALMEATAEWGLIRHSIEALNFCFTQPYEKEGKYYLKLTKDIIGNGQITMIKQSDNTTIIPDTVRQWVLEGKCTPLNPSWLFVNEKQPKAKMWSDQEVTSILTSEQFLSRNCPTYDVVKMIQADGASIPIASLKKQLHRKSQIIKASQKEYRPQTQTPPLIQNKNSSILSQILSMKY